MAPASTRSRIIDDGWTEQQVREALRTSPEYRERNTMTSAKAWTQQDVERELRRSDQFRNRPR
ncbi:MAG: hypothetical protein ABL986_23415 [Vicinamibacterales bacterium]